MQTITRQVADVRAVDMKKRTVRLGVSSERVDSHGSIILQDGMDLERRYRSNPIFCWSHPVGGGCDTPGPENALGKAIEIERDGSKTIMTFQFMPAGKNPRADLVLEQYELGILNACSVGLTDVKEVRASDPEEELLALPDAARAALLRGEARYVIASSTLMEVSACFVGSNLDALAQRDVDRRMEARERAFCERANKMMRLAEEQFQRITVAADKLERLAMSPEERKIAEARAALLAWASQ